MQEEQVSAYVHGRLEHQLRHQAGLHPEGGGHYEVTRVEPGCRYLTLWVRFTIMRGKSSQNLETEANNKHRIRFQSVKILYLNCSYQSAVSNGQELKNIYIHDECKFTVHISHDIA